MMCTQIQLKCVQKLIKNYNVVLRTNITFILSHKLQIYLHIDSFMSECAWWN